MKWQKLQTDPKILANIVQNNFHLDWAWMKWQNLQTVYFYHPKIIADIMQNNFSFGLSLNEVAEIADSILLSPKNTTVANIVQNNFHLDWAWMKWQKLQTVYSYHPKIIANIGQNNFSFGNRLSLNEEAEIATVYSYHPKIFHLHWSWMKWQKLLAWTLACTARYLFGKWKKARQSYSWWQNTTFLYFYLVWWEHCEGERQWRLLWKGEGGQSHSGIYKDGQPVRGTAISTRKYVSSKEGKSREISSMADQRPWIYWKQKDTKEYTCEKWVNQRNRNKDR